MKIIEKNKEKINLICRYHKVNKLYLFGSAINNNLKLESDIDFLVSFKKFDLAEYFENYMLLKEKFKQLFKREIDLVEEQSLKNPILINSINKNKELIYG